MTPGAQPSHQGQCSDLPGPSASALACRVTAQTEGQGARPTGERDPEWKKEEGKEEKNWEQTQQGKGFPKLSIPSAEPAGRDSHAVIWGKVCQAREQ